MGSGGFNFKFEWISIHGTNKSMSYFVSTENFFKIMFEDVFSSLPTNVENKSKFNITEYFVKPTINSNQSAFSTSFAQNRINQLCVACSLLDRDNIRCSVVLNFIKYF